MKINMNKPNIWITYTWKDNEKGNFDYIVQELKAIGIESRYDKIELIPGRHLWDQIGDKIINGPFSAWCYLITPESLKSKPCKEELAYALYRAMSDKNDDYPLIGLVHGASISDIPPALKVRLCVNLADPNWKEQIKAGIEAKPPQSETTSQTQFIYQTYKKDTSITIEVKPRFGEVMYWRFAIPKNVNLFSLDSDYKQYLKDGKVSDILIKAFKDKRIFLSREAKVSIINETLWKIADGMNSYIIEDTSIHLNICKNVKVIKWGYGPAGRGSISGSKTNSLEGLQGKVNGVPTTYFGTGDKLSPGISAYVVLDEMPDFIGFGLASEPFGAPTQLEIYNLKNENFS